MIVQCPQCSIRYNVPDDKIGDAPRRLRCNRCKCVFTVARRSEEPPTGYEEFTASSKALPPEFAFLREAASDESRPQPVEAEPPAATEPVAVPSSETTYKGPPPSPPSYPPPPATGSSPPAPMKSASVPPPRQGAASTNTCWDDEPPTKRLPVSVAPPQPQAEPWVHTWEHQDPLELDDFAVSLTHPHAKAVGIVLTAALGLAVLFLIFVAYRNGWTLSQSSLPNSISYALSSRPTERRLPAEVRGLEITVESIRTINRPNAPAVLAVEGSVFNNSPIKKTDVVLRLRIFDTKSDILLEAEKACGKFLQETEIMRLEPGQAKRIRASSCSISATSTAAYQFLFEEFPLVFDPEADVEIKAVAAAIR